jgi:hypothetical protein
MLSLSLIEKALEEKCRGLILNMISDLEEGLRNAIGLYDTRISDLY